jgi:peptide chain release factor 1
MKPFLRQQLARYADRLGELEFLLSREDIMKDMSQFMALSREHTEVASVASRWTRYQQREADLASAREMLVDPDMAEMAQEEVDSASAELQQLETELQRMLLPKDPDDARNAFVEIRAGTGGDESALFAGDLLRMYTRYADRRGWKSEIVSESPSELGGYKEVVVRIEGDNVYGALKFESGGHRVQRVPATETQGRIHTSACTVAVLAEQDEAEAIKINPSDLRIDTYRASGAGGQHINKTDSAVRLTHIPTGIVVQCQDGRSQHSNRDVAWKRLRSRLYDFELRKQQEAQQKLEDSKTDVGWGHQIRSYVLDQSRIKDLRTNYETSATQKVLDGDLDPFIEASLKQGV